MAERVTGNFISGEWDIIHSALPREYVMHSGQPILDELV
jgi:hypothetical protein